MLKINPYYWEDRVFDGCGISAVLSRHGLIDGTMIMESACRLQNRGNEFGGGFAAFGLYPDYADHFALHIIGIHTRDDASKVRDFLEKRLEVNYQEKVLHKNKLEYEPGLYRFFCKLYKEDEYKYNEDKKQRAYVVDVIDDLHKEFPPFFVISSGKNYGIFKGVASAIDVAEHYNLSDMEAYCWIHHDRFPTNSTSEAKNAHPHSQDGFDFAIVHNGEISSYGANRLFLESHGYTFPIATDSLVIAKALTFFKYSNFELEDGCRMVLCAPTWSEIDRMPENKRKKYKIARIKYGSLILDGPFSIIVGHQDGMFGLRDRKGLRPLVHGYSKDYYFFSSEEASIRAMCPQVTKVAELTPGVPLFYKREGVAVVC